MGSNSAICMFAFLLSCCLLLKEICYSRRFNFGRTLLSKEANRKSHKLSPLIEMVENTWNCVHTLKHIRRHDCRVTITILHTMPFISQECEMYWSERPTHTPHILPTPVSPHLPPPPPPPLQCCNVSKTCRWIGGQCISLFRSSLIWVCTVCLALSV